MGIFSKLFGALKKSKDNLSEKLRVLFSKNKLGNEFYEELEEILISSDVSVTTAEEVVERTPPIMRSAPSIAFAVSSVW